LTAVVLEIVDLPPADVAEIYQRQASLIIPAVLSVGEVIDHFEVLKQLAKDARSEIYLVLNKLDGKKYVLKAPSKNYKNDRNYLEDFAKEQWIGLRMNHPGLMKIFEQPHPSQYLYYVSEYIDGITLKQWMAEHERASLADTISLLNEMVKPVRYMHRNNLVHRDLKPENFLINKKGELKLIDYGTVQIAGILELARGTQKESPIGDIRYIAPEILVTGSSSNRSDIFSLACIVYEMIAGELPYSAILSNSDQPRQYDLWVYRSINKNQKLLLQLPPWLDLVMKKALAPDPKNRYSTLSEFQANLVKPSEEITRATASKPLIETNPLLVWKVLALILTTLLIVETVYFTAGR
jgi:serine/threonine protein kinase